MSPDGEGKEEDDDDPHTRNKESRADTTRQPHAQPRQSKTKNTHWHSLAAQVLGRRSRCSPGLACRILAGLTSSFSFRLLGFWGLLPHTSSASSSILSSGRSGIAALLFLFTHLLVLPALRSSVSCFCLLGMHACFVAFSLLPLTPSNLTSPPPPVTSLPPHDAGPACRVAVHPTWPLGQASYPHPHPLDSSSKTARIAAIT